MLSSEDLEKLIASKKREIEREKMLLGLTPPPENFCAQDKENTDPEEPKIRNYQETAQPTKQVNFKENVLHSQEVKGILCSQSSNENAEVKEDYHKTLYELEEKIPPDLERYIRRYIGIPVMLKAGEYSPNNPLLRGDRAAGGDALLGLGEYERRRNTLRKIRQAQYRQYLDQQAKKKQEAKEQVERERREHEEKERQREERERQLLLERDRYSPERRRASVSSVPVSNALVYTTKVDTGVQVDGVARPLSVAVQTDDVELYRLSPSPSKCLTQAERELSPRTVADSKPEWGQKWDTCERRRSYGDFDERTCSIKKSNREKLVSDLRHSYMPSIFDADAIQMRNLQAEKDAAERRQFYQQELKNQILEQQRIREERKSREKMLEQAEMRRLEEQLRMLRVAQETEVDRQRDISTAMKENAKVYESKRIELQRDIDAEKHKMMRTTSQPIRNQPKRNTTTSKSETERSKLPFYYPHEKTFQPIEKDKKPYSFNIPENSVFSANYDVDSYLRKNLNYREKIDAEIENIGNNNKNENYENVIQKYDANLAKGDGIEITENYVGNMEKRNSERNITEIKQKEEYNAENRRGNYENVIGKQSYENFERRNTENSEKRNFQNAEKRNFQNIENGYKDRNVIIEKALIHEPRAVKNNGKRIQDVDNLSIPVLRNSPKRQQETIEVSSNLSDAMKKIDDKWKVPAVQKNILKSLPNEEGKNISILTQLGSIRRQLQLEQLKLDRMLSKDES